MPQPADVIARLHDHEKVEALNHNAWNGILHALVDAIARYLEAARPKLVKPKTQSYIFLNRNGGRLKERTK